MSLPFLGEIRLVPYNFAPLGWMECDGRLLSISQNEALFALLGTIYGGDGQSTFALPDLRGRIAIGQGTGPGLPNILQGELAGSETVTLVAPQIPGHRHPVNVTAAGGTSTSPVGKTFAYFGTGTKSDKVYGPAAGGTASPAMIGQAGGSQPHENRQPSLTLRYIIATEGVFPSRN